MSATTQTDELTPDQAARLEDLRPLLKAIIGEVVDLLAEEFSKDVPPAFTPEEKAGFGRRREEVDRQVAESRAVSERAQAQLEEAERELAPR